MCTIMLPYTCDYNIINGSGQGVQTLAIKRYGVVQSVVSSKDTSTLIGVSLFLDLGKLGMDLGHCVPLDARIKQAESIVIRLIG